MMTIHIPTTNFEDHSEPCLCLFFELCSNNDLRYTYYELRRLFKTMPSPLFLSRVPIMTYDTHTTNFEDHSEPCLRLSTQDAMKIHILQTSKIIQNHAFASLFESCSDNDLQYTYYKLRRSYRTMPSPLYLSRVPIMTRELSSRTVIVYLRLFILIYITYTQVQRSTEIKIYMV